LIPRKSLILPQSRESAKVRARLYFLNAYRPCSAKAITLALLPNFPSRKTEFLMPRNITNSQRRHKFTDKVFFLYFLIMRFCIACRRAGAVCLISDESDFYKQYFRYNRSYNLAFPAYE
jgi:hypothetical protein